MSDGKSRAFDPYNFSDDQALSMSVTASCFAVLLSAIEEMLERSGETSAEAFRESVDKSMNAVYAEAKHVDSTATRQAQRGASARIQVLLFLRENLEDIRNWKKG